AMLAFDTGLPTGYDIGLTILSFAVAVLVTGLGLATPAYWKSDLAALAGGVIFGVGIASMHFIGMKGLLVPAVMTWDHELVLLAWLLGCGFAAWAIRQAIADTSMWGRGKAAVTLTLAICSMHFTGMGALELMPSPLVPMPDAYLTPDRLAIEIGLAAFVILALSTSGALVDQHLAGCKALEAERLHGLVNATFEGIGICIDGKLVEANDVLVDLLKTPLSMLHGQSFTDFIAPDQRDAYAKKLRSGEESAIELPLTPASGAPVFAELLIKPINYGNRSAVVIAVRDITERQAARENLEQYRDHLEQLVADRTAELKDQAMRLEEALDEERKLAGLQRQFVSMVSHEFRTPLAIIDGNAQRLLRRHSDGLSGRAVKALDTVRRSVTRLTELMESVLAAARLEDGRIDFRPAACSLPELIQETARNYGELYPDHKIVVSIDDLPDRITADGKLLRQVISNLVSNAVKYSPDKTRVWVDGSVDDHGDIVIAVRDEGVGIPADEQQLLFDRFFRASTSTGIAGSGIGLHLALHLVQMHRGMIDVESVEGQGTTFRVRIPIEPVPTPDSEQVQTASNDAMSPHGLAAFENSA
ncbi:MAG: ATP-binding protein, partial [Geminicoccaceae bacterium]